MPVLMEHEQQMWDRAYCAALTGIMSRMWETNRTTCLDDAAVMSAQCADYAVVQRRELRSRQLLDGCDED